MRVKTALAVLTAAMTLTACTTTNPTDSSAPAGGGGAATTEHTDDISAGVQPDPAAVALLPADVKAKGTLVSAEDLSSPPTTFMASDNKTPIGFNPDIARLIAAKLGLKLQINNIKFDTIITGLQADRYDFTASTMGATKDRLKVLDMVDYVNSGTYRVFAEGCNGDLSPFIGTQLFCGVLEGNNKQMYSTAVPSTLTWKVGDRVMNSAPSSGNPRSWVCTVAGTPGTWVSEGNLP